jgi:hypothetical protein
MSLNKRLFLALMAIGEKGQIILWLNLSMLPILGNVGIQLGTLKYPGNGFCVVGRTDRFTYVEVSLISRGHLT